MRIAPEIVLTAEEEKALTRLSLSHTSSVRLARRAQIVFFPCRGQDNSQSLSGFCSKLHPASTRQRHVLPT